MNTQQKRVKWSRGETTDALEERTDTGITNVSAEFMENVVCDIYGNVSRRPALKLLDFVIGYPSMAGGVPLKDFAAIPFFISENDFIVLSPGWCFRVKNRKIVARGSINVPMFSGTFVINRNTSYAQQNNYMIIANDHAIWKLTVELERNSDEFELNAEPFDYGGGWYAPNGTKDSGVSDTDISGLLFNEDKLGASPYTATNPDGSTTVYSLLDTGLTGEQLQDFQTLIPLGSIVHMPNLGCSLRVEGYRVGNDKMLFSDIFDGVLLPGQSVPQTGRYAKFESGVARLPTIYYAIGYYINGVRTTTVKATGGEIVETTSGFYSVGDDVWSEVSASSLKLYVYGALLTPIVDKSLTDSNVNVTTGYISLSPDANGFPHPAVVVFKDQRLWTSRYIYGSNGADVVAPEFAWYSYPGLVVSSQIAKYTDFKNDYNYENEAITLDILTKFKEEVIYLADYNGLKIFTDYAEYDYNGGVVRQSENGALKGCQPLVFGSLLLYADKTGHQIKAMQYELQSNIFASNIVNNLCPADLVNTPVRFAAEEEKEHYVGRFLYVLNSGENSPRVSVCDFVPDTQNIIWTRWDFGWKSECGTDALPAVADILPTKKPIFVVRMGHVGGCFNGGLMLAELDYDAILDFQASLSPSDTYYKVKTYTTAAEIETFVTLVNTTVAVYDGDKFMWYDTTNNSGKLTKSLSSLTNPIVGVPINAKIRSHPIDIGGKTKSIAKRISKSLLSMRNTNAGAITVNKKTGYWNPDNSYVNFYNCTGMKREVKLEIENIHSAKFTIESVLMNIEYGTLVS